MASTPVVAEDESLHRLDERLMTRPLIIHQYRSIDSTQKEARRQVASCDRRKITLWVADEQTQGMGTRGRRWLSPAGGNLYMTLLLFWPERPFAWPHIAQVTSLTLAETLGAMAIQLRLKWPNDLFYGGGKVGGVLAELLSEEGAIALLLGVGLNLHMESSLLASIDQPASCLFPRGTALSGMELLYPFMERLLPALEELFARGFSSFAAAYEQWSS